MDYDCVDQQEDFISEMIDEKNNNSERKVLPFIHQSIVNEFLCMLSESYKEGNKHADKIVDMLYLTEEEIFSFLPYDDYKNYLCEVNESRQGSYEEDMRASYEEYESYYG